MLSQQQQLHTCPIIMPNYLVSKLFWVVVKEPHPYHIHVDTGATKGSAYNQSEENPSYQHNAPYILKSHISSPLQLSLSKMFINLLETRSFPSTSLLI